MKLDTFHRLMDGSDKGDSFMNMYIRFVEDIREHLLQESADFNTNSEDDIAEIKRYYKIISKCTNLKWEFENLIKEYNS